MFFKGSCEKGIALCTSVWWKSMMNEWMNECVFICTAHITYHLMAVYNSIEWDWTSACEGASGCRCQFIFDLTHPPNHAWNVGYEMDHHDMAIMTSDFSPRHLLLAISANPVKLNRPVVVFIAAWWNIEFLFVDCRGSGARTTSIVGGHWIKWDHNSYCSRAGITIYHIQGHLAFKLLTFEEIEELSQLSMESITGMQLHHMDFVTSAWNKILYDSSN